MLAYDTQKWKRNGPAGFHVRQTCQVISEGRQILYLPFFSTRGQHCFICSQFRRFYDQFPPVLTLRRHFTIARRQVNIARRQVSAARRHLRLSANAGETWQMSDRDKLCHRLRWQNDNFPDLPRLVQHRTRTVRYQTYRVVALCIISVETMASGDISHSEEMNELK